MSEISLKDKLHEYSLNKSVDLRNELVLDYVFLVKNVAKSTRGLYSYYATMDDVVNNGILCLMDCIERFDESKGIEFEAYAYSRIKNATIDFIRKQDYLPRRVRQTAKGVSKAYNELAHKNMREPTDVELAEYMEISVSDLNKHYSEMSTSNFLSIEELSAFLSTNDYADHSDSSDPQAQFDRHSTRQALIKAIKQLNEKEILVISLAYYENLKLKEIAKVLDVSEARVSQIHSKAIIKLRNLIMEQRKELEV